MIGSRLGLGAGSQGGLAVPETIGRMMPDKLDSRIREILDDELAALF